MMSEGRTLQPHTVLRLSHMSPSPRRLPSYIAVLYSAGSPSRRKGGAAVASPASAGVSTLRGSSPSAAFAGSPSAFYAKQRQSFSQMAKTRE